MSPIVLAVGLVTVIGLICAVGLSIASNGNGCSGG